MNTALKDLDALASKFIIGHKKLSQAQKSILERIEKLKGEEKRLENRKKRIKNLIEIMYKKL